MVTTCRIRTAYHSCMRCLLPASWQTRLPSPRSFTPFPELCSECRSCVFLPGFPHACTPEYFLECLVGFFVTVREFFHTLFDMFEHNVFRFIDWFKRVIGSGAAPAPPPRAAPAPPRAAPAPPRAAPAPPRAAPAPPRAAPAPPDSGWICCASSSVR